MADPFLSELKSRLRPLSDAADMDEFDREYSLLGDIIKRVKRAKRVSVSDETRASYRRKAEIKRRARLQVVPELQARIKELRTQLASLSAKGLEYAPVAEPERESVPVTVPDRARAVRQSCERHRSALIEWLVAEEERLNKAVQAAIEDSQCLNSFLS